VRFPQLPPAGPATAFHQMTPISKCYQNGAVHVPLGFRWRRILERRARPGCDDSTEHILSPATGKSILVSVRHQDNRTWASITSRMEREGVTGARGMALHQCRRESSRAVAVWAAGGVAGSKEGGVITNTRIKASPRETVDEDGRPDHPKRVETHAGPDAWCPEISSPGTLVAFEAQSKSGARQRTGQRVLIRHFYRLSAG